MSAINTLKQSTTKKPLPEILKIDKNNFKIYKNFIKDCMQYYYIHTYSYHSPPVDYELESFFNWLQSDVLL